MRFSTRNTHKHGKIIAFAASAAVLGLGGIVSQIIQKDAAAEISSVSSKIFYANTDDYNSIEAAAAAAATALESENAAFCAIGTEIGNTVTRINPYTQETAQYWVFAKDSSSCSEASATAPEGEVLLNDNGATVLSKTYDDTYMAENYAKPLGPLGAFHVIGFNQLDLGNQTNGNILTPNLNSAGSYIGYFEEPTISYARAIGSSIGSSFSFANAHDNNTNVLVTGRTTAVGNADNGKQWTINHAKSNMPDRIVNGVYADNLWQESATSEPFLDIAELKDDAKAWNAELSAQAETLTADDYDFSDQNKLAIYIPEEGKNSLNVLKLDKSMLTGSHDICIYGFDQHIPGTLLLNIDLAGETDVHMNNSFKLCYQSAELVKYPDSIQGNATSVDDINFNDGSRKCVREQWIHDKFENHIILNFYDSTKDDKNYTGNINIQRETTSFAIAPEADIEITASSYQGILIANNIDSEADTYYLSLNDLQPLTPRPSTCKIKVQHVNKNTMQVIDGYTHEYTNECADNAYYTFGPESYITDTLGLSFVDGLYEGEESAVVYHAGTESESAQTTIENNETIDGDLFPVGFYNDQESKVITLYYEPVCSLVVHHLRYIDAETQTTIRDDDPIIFTCGEIAEVGHAQDLLDAGYIAVGNDGLEPPVVTPTPIGVVDDPTEVYLYYKLNDEPVPDVCSIEIHHYIVGTTTPVDDDITMTHYCGNIEFELDISQKALSNGYKFVSGRLESERYVADYTADDFPMSVTNNFPHKTYILYYDKEDPDTPDTPDTKDRSPIFVLSAAGAIIGLGTATMFIARRRQ